VHALIRRHIQCVARLDIEGRVPRVDVPYDAVGPVFRRAVGIGDELLTQGTLAGLGLPRLRVREAYSGIDVQLKRRLSLIPNLVETVRGYASHERETLENVTRARAALQSAGSPGEAAQANNFLTQTLRSLFAVSEAYPDLKANQNFLALQEELTSTENKISFARQAYNDAVLFFNNKIEMFPSNVIAGMFNFRPEVFFEIAEPTERDAPKVSFTR
jgi:LemA protein